ncbi:MAG: class I mannose-6-phosphate isomerase [Solobacterium sp.]|jgi:mannose-6-phosphate isomerase class I|nr:class I mannose-6-phosphate isomerase [Solobacterium sp.]
MSNYDRFPHTKLEHTEGRFFRGYQAILEQLKTKLPLGHMVLTVETYPGVNDAEILPQLKQLNPDLLIETVDLFKSEADLNEQMKYFLTEDRVFGKMYYGDVIDFMDTDRLTAAQKQTAASSGLVIIYGFGASLVNKGNVLVYLDMARWEIQLRYRKGMPNYKCSNSDEDILRKVKRGYFIEWRIADKLKQTLFDDIDYVIDTNKENDPKMITGELFREGLKKTVSGPFRLVPYFDPGVWGGQWMKEHCNLDPKEKNYAWSFDGVPEENSLLLNCDGIDVEIPAQDAVLYQPKQLLGPQVFARFGSEFPIRFDFLDTIGGQNLSLQVHPTMDYMHRQFGMAYTQNESYYILDAKEDACVYLGLKDGVNPKEMLFELQEAQDGGAPFNAEKFVNKFPAKKHDHFLIPAGTIHCSGSDAMVLEISETPYIFTFKLWDWGRLGLDGKPRPINIERGSHVIQWNRTTEWVKTNLVNAVQEVRHTDEYVEEHTGLHALEFIETRRYFTEQQFEVDTADNVNMCNLVEGSSALITSLDQKFEPFEVHYAETFILPADAGRCVISSPDHSRIGVIRAYVRTPKA